MSKLSLYPDASPPKRGYVLKKRNFNERKRYMPGIAGDPYINGNAAYHAAMHRAFVMGEIFRKPDNPYIVEAKTKKTESAREKMELWDMGWDEAAEAGSEEKKGIVI
jgi:hypothetical protein